MLFPTPVTICLIGCFISSVLPFVIKRSTPVCEYEGSIYQDGEMFLNGCKDHCTCSVSGGHANITCESMCPPLGMPRVGFNCTMVPDPFSPNCCEVQVCVPAAEFPSCVRNGITIREGEVWFLGNEVCVCLKGTPLCEPWP